MALVNLTPHPMHIYPLDCPDTINPGAVQPIATIPPTAGLAVRLGETVVGLGPTLREGIPTVDIRFGTADTLPATVPGQFLITSRPVAMANPGRADLLVPHQPVRDRNGNILGCRAFARPIQ